MPGNDICKEYNISKRAILNRTFDIWYILAIYIYNWFNSKYNRFKLNCMVITCIIEFLIVYLTLYISNNRTKCWWITLWHCALVRAYAAFIDIYIYLMLSDIILMQCKYVCYSTLYNILSENWQGVFEPKVKCDVTI